MVITNQMLENIRSCATTILSGRAASDKFKKTLTDIQSLPEYDVVIRVGECEYTVPRKYHGDVKKILTSMYNDVVDQYASYEKRLKELIEGENDEWIFSTEETTED